MAAGELPEAELTDFKVEIPADRKNGDYSTNAAMAWARAFRRAPAMIAAAITKNIDLEGTAFLILRGGRSRIHKLPSRRPLLFGDSHGYPQEGAATTAAPTSARAKR